MSTATRLPRRDATANPPPVLRPLFEALRSHDGPVPLAELQRELEALELTSEDLGDSIQIDTGSYVRTLVLDLDHVEVLVMAWLPGQRSPIHDHAGSACAVKVVSGSAVERIFRKRPDGRVEPEGVRRHVPGQVTCSFDADIHSMENAVDRPASPRDILVTVHVYSPPLAPTRKYEQAPATI